MTYHITSHITSKFITAHITSNGKVSVPGLLSVALHVEEDCVHHGESPVGGQKGLELQSCQAAHHHQLGGPHQQPALQRPLGEGDEKVRIETHHHHHRAPRQLTHLLTEDTLADSGNSAMSLAVILLLLSDMAK